MTCLHHHLLRILARYAHNRAIRADNASIALEQKADAAWTGGDLTTASEYRALAKREAAEAEVWEGRAMRWASLLP